MSWWVYLKEGDECVPVAPHNGSGESTAQLHVTYNYSERFRVAFDGLGFFEALYGKQAKEVIPLLERAVKHMGYDPIGDYRANTRGSAGHALAVLLGWARQHPQAIFTIH